MKGTEIILDIQMLSVYATLTPCFLHLTKLSLPTTKFQMHSKVLVPSHEFNVLLLALGCRYMLSMTSMCCCWLWSGDTCQS